MFFLMSVRAMRFAGESEGARGASAEKYQREKLIFSGVNLGLYVLAPLLVLVSGFSVWMRDVVSGWSSDATVLGAVIYAVIAGVGMGLLTLPLSFYSGHVLEMRYGLSRQGVGKWASDWLKSEALQLVFLALFVGAVYWLLESDPNLWWVWAWLFFTGLSVFLSWLTPIVLLPLFFKFEPLPDGDLKDRLLALSERLGTRVRGAYIWKLGDRTVKANAALTGWGGTRRIIISDTLLEHHTADEIEVIIAHELGHHVHRDIWRMLVVQTVLIFVSMWFIDVALDAWSASFGLSGELHDYANLPLLSLVTTGVGLVALPLANSYSRRRETAADDFALRVTGMRSEFVSAMEKLGSLNLANRDPHWLLEMLLHSHPSVARRVERAKSGG